MISCHANTPNRKTHTAGDRTVHIAVYSILNNTSFQLSISALLGLYASVWMTHLELHCVYPETISSEKINLIKSQIFWNTIQMKNMMRRAVTVKKKYGWMKYAIFVFKMFSPSILNHLFKIQSNVIWIKVCSVVDYFLII